MRTHRVSASSVWLTKHCLAWARPDWPEPPPMVSNAKMERGNRVHTLIEVLHGNEEVPAGVKADELACAKSAMGYLSRMTDVRLELPIAWDWVSGATRVLPSEYHRDYRDARATEIPGTADLVATRDGELQIVDWKTGLSKWPHYGPQVRFLGMAAAELSGETMVDTAIVKLSPVDAKVGERYRLDMFDLAAEQEELSECMATLPDAQPQPGEHCRYCNSRSLCPAFAARAEAS